MKIRTKEGDNIQKATRWVCFIACVLTLVVGLIHVCDKEARLKWPKDTGFLDDTTNLISWRGVFSFAPSVFVETWTGVFFGIIGICSHIDTVKPFDLLTTSFRASFIFMLVCGLFATMAFAGGIGILFSICTYIGAAMSLYCSFRAEGSAMVGIKVD